MTERFQILALDGGGIKGMFSAAVLAHLEDDLGIRLVNHFDLITGTSTGGIIALGLGLGMRPREILKFYVEHGPAIFPAGLSRRVFKSKFSAEPLEKALKSCFGDQLLGESGKRLVVPAYNLGEDHVYVFKTAHHPRLTRDYKVPVWKVARATSAAPTYFPAYTSVDNVRIIDGGVWANNPTLVGIAEAVSMLDVPLSAISVFSLGTTDEVKLRAEHLDHGGMWHWRQAGVDVVLRGQSIGAVTMAHHLLGADKVARLDPAVPDGLFALDKLLESALLGKAAHESRHFAPKFSEMFAPHIAPEFTPYNGQKEASHA
ncbi:MAG: patatin-like phospholipase family protein [Desulfobacterales bacterium]|nr:patatin-like phospholipase family protein [Desulfobacterales bacterium]